MKIKEDYCQDVPRVIVCNDPGDPHIELWMMGKGEDGKVFPVEMQMTRKGAMDLSTKLLEAHSDLWKIELDNFRRGR